MPYRGYIMVPGIMLLPLESHLKYCYAYAEANDLPDYPDVLKQLYKRTISGDGQSTGGGGGGGVKSTTYERSR